MKANSSATQLFVVTLEDAYGNPTTRASATTFTLASTSSSVNKRFSLTSGGSATTTATITTGASSVNVYYADTQPGTPTITATYSGLTTASQIETVTPGTATQLAITTSPLSFTATNSPTHALTITLEDAYGNPTTSASAITVGLNSSSSGDVFALTSAGAGVTQVTLAAGASSVNVYYGDTVAGSPLVTVSASSLTSGTQSETVSAGTATQLVITTSPLSFTATNSPTHALTITLEDAYGNPTTSASAISIDLTSSSGGGRFALSYGGSHITSPASVVLAAGSSSVSVYYGDSSSGTPKITVSASGLTSGTQTETLT
jgi:hypothetical protein